MDRPERPSSRIPSAGPLRPSASRLPGTRPTLTLGKRAAGEAGLSDDAASTRRALNAAQVQQTTLERKQFELERELRARADEVEEARRLAAKLRQEREILLDAETKLQREIEEREQQWGAERDQLSKSLNAYRAKARDAQAALAANNYETVKADNARMKADYARDVELRDRRLKAVEEERDVLRGWHRRYETAALEIQELRGQLDAAVQARDEAKNEWRTDEIVRGEVARQSESLVSLQNERNDLQAEVLELRKWKNEGDAKENAAKHIQRDLKDQIHALNLEVERTRNELDTFRNFVPEDKPIDDALTLHQRLSALSKLHTELQSKLDEKTAENDRLHKRLSKVAIESKETVLDLSRKFDDASRELRWATERCRNAESRERLLKAELENSPAPAPAGGSSDSTANVHKLQNLVNTYKAEIEAMERDSRGAEERLAKGAGLVKAAALKEAQERGNKLESDIAHLQETVTQLTADNESLNTEVSELMRRVWSGEFNPERERCLELAANPAAKVRAVRTEQLNALKAENAALLDRLATVDHEPSGAGSASSAESRGLVPRISYDRLQKEKADLEAAHEKRLRRLKEIFGAKSREFLEAAYSLLGWRIKFDENGTDIRLTSMYAPKGRMGLTLKFTSNEGHFGTMAMMGGMARSLEEARDFWVTERQSIPGFLAQVTTEMFEKTTLGRAAGYVGLE